MPPVAVNCGTGANLQFVEGGELLVRSAGGTKLALTGPPAACMLTKKPSPICPKDPLRSKLTEHGLRWSYGNAKFNEKVIR